MYLYQLRVVRISKGLSRMYWDGTSYTGEVMEAMVFSEDQVPSIAVFQPSGWEAPKFVKLIAS